MGRVADWLDERTGYRRALEAALDEPVRGGASWAYVFGSVLTFLLLLQAVTGVLLAFTYSPSATDAWASVAYIQDRVAAGWLIRGLHHHGASAMVVVAGLHLLQVAIYGAYRRPREVNWLLGVVMLGVVLAFALTGYLLPWDQKGYWATKVATGLVGATPVIGGALQRLLQGGNEYGNLTLTRFYALHVFVLPATILLLVVLHIALFRRHGVTTRPGRTEAELEARTQPFWPDQLFRDVVAMGIVFAAIFVAAWGDHGAPLAAPADPASGYDARPEWYFLPLFQLLKYFNGSLEVVAALGVPALCGAFLLALPFLDRGPDRSPARRAAWLSLLSAGVVGAGVLILLAVRSDDADAELRERQAAAGEKAQLARTLALTGVPPAGGLAIFDKLATPGERLFAEHCAGCHAGDERKAPELGPGYNSRAWIRGFLLDPQASRFYGLVKRAPEGRMKPVKQTGAELDALVELVYAETGARDADRALAARGRELAADGDCSNCHDLDADKLEGQAPNLAGRGRADWLAALIADPGRKRFFGAHNDEMPAFADKLTAEEIGILADYLVSLRAAPAP